MDDAQVPLVRRRFSRGPVKCWPTARAAVYGNHDQAARWGFGADSIVLAAVVRRARCAWLCVGSGVMVCVHLRTVRTDLVTAHRMSW
jgi:hypothetical protein